MVRQISCSGNQTAVHFGLGPAKTVTRLEIRWPSGIRQQLRNLQIDRRIAVKEPKR
jgi:hypothetical protein